MSVDPCPLRKRLLPEIGGSSVVKIIGGFFLFAVTFLGISLLFSKVSGVTIDDIPPFYNLGARHPELQVVAGDVYAISPDGVTQERLCTMELRENAVRREPIDAQYSNTVADSFPIVQRLFDAIRGQKPETDAGVSRRIVFEGEFTQLGQRAAVQPPADCEGLMASKLNSRHLICLVKSSLIPKTAPSFSAYVFYPDQIYLPASVFAAHEMERNENVDKIGVLPCPGESGVPWDVALRKVLNVVTEHPDS